MIKYSVGLDVSSKKIAVCISTIDIEQSIKVKGTTTVPNTMGGFKKLHTWIEKYRKDTAIPIVVCMEATGVYHEGVALYLFELDYSLSVLLPNKSKKYLQSLGIKSKNDSIDARGLAQMSAEQKLKKWSPPAKFFHTLRSYSRQYQNIQEQKTMTKNQIHAISRGMYPNKMIVKQLEKLIALFDKQLKELANRMEKHINSNKEISKKVEQICLIKGVSTLSVCTIIAETNGFELFENFKQLISYAGYDVVENQSGKHTGKTKMSKKGNSRIRRALFMPAFNVVRYEQKAFFDLFHRTLEKHNIKMKSYVAVQKKILTTIFALWKKNEAYIEDYPNKSTNKNSHTQGAATQGKQSKTASSLVDRS